MEPNLTEINKSVENLNKAFHDFKQENDKAQETRDAAQDEKVQRISDHMDELEDKLVAVQNESARIENTELQQARNEYSEKFYNDFMRKGDDSGLQDLAVRAELSTSVGSEGGVTIPEELDREILLLARDRSPMRPWCTVRQIGGVNYRKLVREGEAASGWVGEKAARPTTGTPTFSSLTPSMGEVYANPDTTQQMLDDAFFNVEEFLTDEAVDKFIREENIAFVSGDGTDKPIGVLAGATAKTADDARALGTLQYVETGIADALPAGTALYDFLIDLQDELKEDHEPGAIWMVHRRTRSILRKVKDTDGNYQWETGKLGEAPSTLFGSPVVTNSNFPVVAANAFPILYGDLKRAYYIIDRIGTRVIRDNLTAKPNINFYMTKRVGSMLVDSEAIKLVKCEV